MIGIKVKRYNKIGTIVSNPEFYSHAFSYKAIVIVQFENSFQPLSVEDLTLHDFGIFEKQSNTIKGSVETLYDKYDIITPGVTCSTDLQFGYSSSTKFSYCVIGLNGTKFKIFDLVQQSGFTFKGN